MFEALDAEFHFTLDGAANAANAKVARYLDEEIDSLRHPLPWGRVFKVLPDRRAIPPQGDTPETIWLNPPYSAAGAFMYRLLDEVYEHRATAVALVYSKTDTKWFRDVAMRAAEVRFIHGRLKFEAPPGSYADGGRATTARTPSMLAVFKPHWFGRAPLFSLVDGRGRPLVPALAA